MSRSHVRHRGKLQPVPVPQLVRIWGFEATAADLRAYATLMWVAKTLLTGYVIVSLQQKESVAAVRLPYLTSIVTHMLRWCHVL